MSVRWSIVIPAYNEATRLPRYLDEVVQYFDGRGEAYEVLVVDDGSTDDTAALVETFAATHARVRLVRHRTNRGKGAAVRAGMLAARGEYRLFTDADGATPIGEVKRLEPALAVAPIAVASRALVDPGVAVVARRHRVIAGRFFNWLVARAGLRDVADSQCGFKAFHGRVAEQLFGPLGTRGFGFDVELLLRAQREGHRVVEVPVNWTDQPGSKVGVLKDGPAMLVQIVRARLRLGYVRPRSPKSR